MSVSQPGSGPSRSPGGGSARKSRAPFGRDRVPSSRVGDAPRRARGWVGGTRPTLALALRQASTSGALREWLWREHKLKKKKEIKKKSERKEKKPPIIALRTAGSRGAACVLRRKAVHRICDDGQLAAETGVWSAHAAARCSRRACHHSPPSLCSGSRSRGRADAPPLLSGRGARARSGARRAAQPRLRRPSAPFARSVPACLARACPRQARTAHGCAAMLLCAPARPGHARLCAQVCCRAASTARTECGRLLRLPPGQQHFLPAPAAAGDANDRVLFGCACTCAS